MSLTSQQYDNGEWFSVTLSSIGDAVVTTDAEGRVTFLNPAAEKLTGWTSSDAAGQPLESVFRIVNEYTRQPVENPVARVLRDGAVVGLANHTILIAKNGEEVPIADSAAPIREGNGDIGGVVLIFRDVSAERAAEEARRRLAAIVESSDDAILSKTLDGIITSWNRGAERLYGYSAEEVLGRPISMLVPPERLDELGLIMSRIRRGEIADHFETVRRRKDGTLVDVSVTVSPVADGSGQLIGASTIARNITEQKQIRQAHRESEERFRVLADSSPVLIWVNGLDGCEFVNRAYLEYVGVTQEDVREFDWAQFMHPDDRQQYLDAYRAAFAQRAPYAAQCRFRRLDGEYRWMKSVGIPRFSESGEFLGYVGSTFDITDIKLAEQSVRESEERLRMALDAGRMGTWEWDIPTGKVTWSPGLEAIHGLAPGTFGGNFEAFQHDIHPGERDYVLQSIRETLEQGKEHYLEYRIVWPNGSEHWVEGRGKLFHDTEGKPVRMIGVCTDIDERKRAEDKTQFLADASETLATLVDYESTLQKVARLAVPFFADWCAVDMLDDDDTLRRLGVAHVDPAKVELALDVQRRFPPDPDAPQGVWNIIRTGDSELVPDITDELLEASVREPELLRILRELGLRSYIGVPLSVRGKVLGVLTFITAESDRRYDVDDLAVAEDLAHRAAVAIENTKLYHALREADRRKDEFLALLGHELRNPLAPISNALHVLRLPQADDAMRQEAREMLERQIEHMVRLVDDLLDVSRIMRGKVELRREPVDLATVVDRAVETVQPVIEAEGHRLDVSLSPEPLWVNGDLVRLAQVVANLLHNAAKYTENGGEIGLATARDDGHAVVRVRDSGIGLAPEALPRIFEMFYQAERRTKDSHGGLGIGLSLVRGLVEAHGGSVVAHSAGLGAGSEFVVRLPLLTNEQSFEDPETARRGAAEHTTSRRVLIVDDNVDAADSLAMLLRLLGHETMVAYDGPAALEQAAANPPAVAFIDLGMPRMDGFEVARQFRADPALKNVALVALTGWGQPEDRQRTRETGFDHHLVKPVEAEVVRQLLSDQLGRKSHS